MGDRTTILGISCDYHDAAAALVVDGTIVAAVEQERFSGTKHDASLPVDAVRSVLELGGVRAAELDHVVFYEKPLVIASRFLATRQREGPRGLGTFLREVPGLLGTNLAIGPRVAAMLRRLGAERPPRLEFVEHHRSHAAAAFYPSPFDHAAVLCVDGIGEWATATIAHGAHHRLELLEELRFPASVGLLYSLVTAWCGFTPNSDEYKLMGLAPYGTPSYRAELEALAEGFDDGSLQVRAADVSWFGARALGRRDLHRRLGGPPRSADEPLTEREADLAASIQAVLEDRMLAMATHAHERTGEDRLCLAGGVALNGVANGRILREGPFRDVWVQPAAGDAGSAIGAALALWHQHLDRPRTQAPRPDAMAGALLGPDLDAAELDLALAAVEHRRGLGTDELAAIAADHLARGEVVAWCRGRMEFGPRALGSRSILADPRSPTVRARLNLDVKGRESFRPFAPAVLAEHAATWFDLDHDSPYMVVVAPVREEHRVTVADEPAAIPERAEVARSTIPACTHVDGSARVQTVTAERHPDLHRVLTAFHERTGCPILVNTSFNRAGETIVASPAAALASAAAGGVDLLVLGDAVVTGDALAAWAASDRGGGS